MTRAERRRLARLVCDLEGKAEAIHQAFAAEPPTGRQLIHTELLSIEEALAHPLFGPGATEAVAGAYAAAHGVGDLICECWGCRGLWRPAWAPVAALAITLDAGRGGLGLLCQRCASLEGQEVLQLILAGLERDFGLENVSRVPAAAIVTKGGTA